jgi:hypothetical protein
MDVSGNRDREGQNVVMVKRHKARNQQWDILYIDELKPQLKNGDMWTEFGMYIGREFSLVTSLSSGRYLDVVGNNVVIKARNQSKSQKWTFDLASRTVINVSTKKSLNFQNN